MVAPSVKGSFTFVGGLNTEGGYFITPENSWKDGVNVYPNVDGVLQRRNGIDYESLYQLYASAITADEKDLWCKLATFCRSMIPYQEALVQLESHLQLIYVLIKPQALLLPMVQMWLVLHPLMVDSL